MNRTPGLRALAALAILLVPSACAPGSDAPRADLIITGARVWTGDDAAPWAEAVAVMDGRILAVGPEGDVLSHRGRETRVLEAGGGLVTPGFIDNHTHFNRAGELLLGVNLLAVSDASELAAEVGRTAERLPEGVWMVGGMWGAYQEWALNSTGGEGAREEMPDLDPDRTVIDPLTPGNPALLWNWDRSRYLANGAALDAAGADCRWAGVECRDGVPTGRLTAGAAERIR
ncbi:MAG TPA: amidohydrolase family protein, partial [Longimicrobiales bacterium]|nr:amidohydrolase family protein [Longimicrobiales bacterium]